MPNHNGMHLNQSDDDKKTKKKSNLLIGDLNAAHKKLPKIKNIHQLSQHFSEQIDCVTHLKPHIFEELTSHELTNQLSFEEILTKFRREFEKLEEDFPGLINETNILHEQVKQLALFENVDSNDAYHKAKKLVNWPLCDVEHFDQQIKKNNEKVFTELLQALSNTNIICAELHEVSLFKVASLYHLYTQDNLSFRVVEMLTALFVTYTSDLPDSLKYKDVVNKDSTYGIVKIKCSLLEIAKKAYEKIIHDLDRGAQQRFADACKNLIMCYEGIKFSAKQMDESIKLTASETEEVSSNEINLPEIPTYTPVASRSSSHPIQSSAKVSHVAYLSFKGEELTTLQFVIPEHKKKAIFIPEIGGMALDAFMRVCLSKEIHLKDTNPEELKIRNNDFKFSFDVGDLASKSQNGLKEATQGKTFPTEYGYSPHSSNSNNLCAELERLIKEQKASQKTVVECELMGQELIDKFFERIFKLLTNSLEQERKEMQEERKKVKKQSSFYNSKPLKKLQESILKTEEKYQKRIQEMKIFKKIILSIGQEHLAQIKIFSAANRPESLSSYCFPKHALQDVEAIIAETATASISSKALR